MDSSVLVKIESLRRASMAGLRQKYQEVFQEPTRCRNRENLFRRIAWCLQAFGRRRSLGPGTWAGTGDCAGCGLAKDGARDFLTTTESPGIQPVGV